MSEKVLTEKDFKNVERIVLEFFEYCSNINPGNFLYDYDLIAAQEQKRKFFYETVRFFVYLFFKEDRGVSGMDLIKKLLLAHVPSEDSNYWKIKSRKDVEMFVDSLIEKYSSQEDI